MMSYKRLIPCIFIAGGKAVKWFDYYDKESGEDSAAPTADMNSGECIVAKNRHGETNIVKQIGRAHV